MHTLRSFYQDYQEVKKKNLIPFMTTTFSINTN